MTLVGMLCSHVSITTNRQREKRLSLRCREPRGISWLCHEHEQSTPPLRELTMDESLPGSAFYHVPMIHACPSTVRMRQRTCICVLWSCNCPDSTVGPQARALSARGSVGTPVCLISSSRVVLCDVTCNSCVSLAQSRDHQGLALGAGASRAAHFL